MISLKLDSITHDIVFDSGELVLVSDAVGSPEQIQQAIKHRFLFFRGEWFLDTEVGLPYFTDIMVKRPNIPNISAIIKAEILKVAGVIDINQLGVSFDIPTRRLTINFTVSTEYGIITNSEIL